MVCSGCCPCSRRNGATWVGVIDLILGSAGLSAVGFLLAIISNEITVVQENFSNPQYQERLHILTGLYWSVLLSYVFPASVTLLAGVFAIFAASQVIIWWGCATPFLTFIVPRSGENNDCCAIIATLLTVIMVFACAGILLILYVLEIAFPFLIPLLIGTLLHMYFTFVLLSFRTNDLKRRRTV